jgi:hypothetical protein
MDIPAHRTNGVAAAFLDACRPSPTPPVPRTRLLIAAVPPLLGDIVRDALADEPGVEVVGTADDEDLSRSVDACAADVVLAEENGAALPDPYLRLMYRHPRLRILTVSPDGRQASLWRLAPERRALADVSPRGLADALRATALQNAAE